MVLFHQWEPLDNFTTAAQPAESVDIEGSMSMVRGSLEIRELHRSKHAPDHNCIFDCDGHTSSQLTSAWPHSLHAQSWANVSSANQRWLVQMSNVDGHSDNSRWSAVWSSSSCSLKVQLSSAPSHSNSQGSFCFT